MLWTVLVNVCICLYAGGMSPCCATQICSVMVLFAAAAIPACDTSAAALFLPSLSLFVIIVVFTRLPVAEGQQ